MLLEVKGNHYIYDNFWYIAYRIVYISYCIKSFIQGRFLSLNVTSLFVVYVCRKYILRCLIQNRYLFVNTLNIEHHFPINRHNGFFNTLDIFSIVVPTQTFTCRWILNLEIKFTIGNLMMAV